VGARDGLEEGEPDVPSSQTSREVALAEGPADRAQPLPPGGLNTRGEAHAELRQRVEGGWEPRLFEAPRAELRRFDPERAALPPASLDVAADYLAQHRTARPWLTAADTASPETRRIFAAMDAGGGHAHIRHEGWATEEANLRRVAYREDPAQLDSGKRAVGIDGLKPGDRSHRCGDAATRLTNPDAFATAFVRGIEHPKIRTLLEMPFDSDRRPGEVTVPIAELLGPDGHKQCTGWQLEPVGDSEETARKNRAAWLRARTESRDPDVPEPRVRPVPTFEGGDMLFVVGCNQGRNGYEVVTMYPRPPRPGH
jgi:hypothetical protein